MSESTVDVASYYNNGMSWEEYLESSSESVRMEHFFDDTELDEDVLAFFNGRTPLQVLAIGEDWCPDVVQNVAVIARICDEVPGMELSVVKRDDNPELMKEYETNGKRRIPVIAFFDMTFRELGRWAGRCKTADEWIFNDVLKGRALEMSAEQKKSFDATYDQRFTDQYMEETISEWQHLLMDEDF